MTSDTHIALSFLAGLAGGLPRPPLPERAQVECEACQGSGTMYGLGAEVQCSVCHGTGHVSAASEECYSGIDVPTRVVEAAVRALLPTAEAFDALHIESLVNEWFAPLGFKIQQSHVDGLCAVPGDGASLWHRIELLCRDVARLTKRDEWATGQYAALQAKSVRDGIAREATARAEEREACAKIAEGMPAATNQPFPHAGTQGLDEATADLIIERDDAIAAAIRARTP